LILILILMESSHLCVPFLFISSSSWAWQDHCFKFQKQSWPRYVLILCYVGLVSWLLWRRCRDKLPTACGTTFHSLF
jgi:hypothetical protein